ncbi:IS3 family transposase [Edwardsiella ictaluri]|nr:IS3 family transposase [Edwardsiella ictaluri]UCQ52740.1 IS3 family transposase [Edwardsiella ictaluri]
MIDGKLRLDMNSRWDAKKALKESGYFSNNNKLAIDNINDDIIGGYNSVAESFFSSLKKERIRKCVYKTRELARTDIFDYIEAFYNRARRHSHPGGVSPEAFERASS